MYREEIGSGGAISAGILSEELPSFEPFKVAAKASLALVCSASMFIPTLTSAAITMRASKSRLAEYASIIKDGSTTQMFFISEAQVPKDAYETLSDLDMLFPSARSSNKYEQQIVAELVNEFFE